MSPLRAVTAATLLIVFGAAAPEDGDNVEIKFADCPPAVKKGLQAEVRGAKIETVTRANHDDGDSIYWADVTIEGRVYAVGVTQDGSLAEMNLAVDDEEISLEKCPAAVRATFRAEAFGAKLDAIGREIKYGVTVFETVISQNGKSYEVVVAEDGTLVEKVLVIDDEEVEIGACPPAVQAALREHARGGGTIGGEITRSTGIGRPTFEAEIELKGKVYLVEVDEKGLLISKSLEAGDE